MSRSRRNLTPVPREFRSPPKPEIRSMRELMARELPPVQWIVPGILPEGVTLLAGKAKIRKSWFAVGLCVAVSSGGYAFGKIRVEQGEVLYAALEDNERRLQSRLGKILAGGGGFPAPESFYYTTDIPRLDEGGEQVLEEWLEEHPECRLVILDTLARIRPYSRGSSGGYQEDYEAVRPLVRLAGDHGVAIVVVTHTRKASATDVLDEINATTGLMGGVDGFLIFKTERGKAEATMYVEGREIEESGELKLRWDRHLHGWMLLGEAEETRLTEQRRAILDALSYAGEPIGPKEIAGCAGIPHGSVRNLLGALMVDGRVERTGRGRYQLAVRENVILSSENDKGDDNGNPDRYAENPLFVTDVIGSAQHKRDPGQIASDNIDDNDDKRALSPIDKRNTNVIGNVIADDADDNPFTDETRVR